MTEIFSNILLLVKSEPELEQMLPTAVWLSSAAGAQLHVLTFIHDPRALKEMADRLEDTTTTPLQIGVLSDHRDFKNEILSTLRALGATLLMLTADLQKIGELRVLRHELEAVVEESPVPVLLIPKWYGGRLPWRSILVPMSGEMREDRALEVSIGLANHLRIPIDIVHVSDPNDKVPTLISGYSDEPHHEFPEMVEEFIAEASPLTSAEECRCIRGFFVHRGSPPEVVLDQVRRSASDLIAVQWKGNFMRGHAMILKSILGQTRAAVLIARADKHAEFRLRAGHEIEGRRRAAGA